jgi:hypothetical protein
MIVKACVKLCKQIIKDVAHRQHGRSRIDWAGW